MRSAKANKDQIAVSAYTAETAINTEQTLDLGMGCAVGDIINADPRREDNANELTGKEEADVIYDNGQLASMNMNFEKAQPQHYAFLLAYGLGSVVSAAAGTGYQHTITPIDGEVDVDRSLPSFTIGQRLGETIAFERLASFFVNSLTCSFAKDAWCKASAQLVGTGKVDRNVTEESITAAENATELTLATEAVAGSTAAERLDAIHQIRAELATGVWTEVTATAVSDATPAVITITAPGTGTDDVTYKVLYAKEAETWETFPARVTETPLRVSQITFTLGGKWSGSAFAGGREMGSEIESVEYNLNNNGAVEFGFGAGGSYGSRYYREGRTQTLKLTREMREYILQNYKAQNEYIGAHILAEGDVFDGAHKYTVELIFPRLGVLSAPISANGKRLAEAGDLQVLEDDTYGSVIARVKNLAATYAG